jgi:hypothetical protein
LEDTNCSQQGGFYASGNFSTYGLGAEAPSDRVTFARLEDGTPSIEECAALIYEKGF